MTVEYCGSGFCDPQKPSIDVACHDLGKEAGKWIMYQVGGKTCYCICSCLGEGTLVTTGDNRQIPVEDIVANVTTVLAAGKSLDFKPTLVGQIVGTPVGETENSIYLTYELDGRRIERVVTMDHPFLLRDKTLVGAGVLQLDDELLDQHGNPVSITALRWGRYVGRFWEFATSITEPDPQLDGHLVLTEGVVTGDYAVTIFVNYPVSKEEMKSPPYAERPLVGTAEWLARNDVLAGELDAGVIEMDHGVFIPAEAFKQSIPDHASAFLPERQAALLRLRAPLEPISNQYLLEMCEYLIERVFEPAYPDINFLFNWYDEQTNAASWVDGISGDPYVYLSGGMARIKGFDIEGVTLAIAQEVGHLIGRPQLENGVTCEGQADWFGGSVVLRTLWFGEAYFANMEKAIKQFELLYRYMRKRGAPDEEVEGPEMDDTGQPYPSNACRIETYRTAMTSPTPPACSLCAPEDDEDDEEDYGEDYDDDDDLDIADGEDQFDDEDYDDEDDGLTAKVSGARDRQRRKKRSLEGEDAGEPMAKVAGARDRQRRKARSLEGEDVGEPMAKVAGARDRQRRKARSLEGEDAGEPMAKVAGARDRQRRKARSLEGEDAGEPMAKVAGARDRQRRKARSLEGEDVGEPMAKVAGARDRQRRKSSSFEDEDVGEPMAKVAGARDRQRRKARSLEGEDVGEPMAKVAGARDRQRRKARSLEGEDAGEPMAKVAGARDRQRRKSSSFEEEDVGEPMAKVAGARDRQRRKARSLETEYEDLGVMAKISGARDRAKKKKFRKAQEPGGSR